MVRIWILVIWPAATLLLAGNESGIQAPSNGSYSTWGMVERTVWYDYRLINPTTEPATDIDVYVPLPRQSPRQKIHYLDLPQRGHSRVFTDLYGQRIVHYQFDRLEPGASIDLGYVVGITLKNIHWDTTARIGSENGSVLTAEERTRYLACEANYSMDSEIMRRTAASLVEGAGTDLEKLVRIHDHIVESIRYVRDDTWDPAATVLSRGTGSCSEYNYVLSGLCRLAGLPTRCVGGTTNGDRQLPTGDTVFHRWTEVYLDGFGWFPVDCSRDANPIRGKRSHFGRVYVDAMVWCQQAGGKDEPLGWDYRAKAHLRSHDPGIRENHRTRWFAFAPESELQAAKTWFQDGTAEIPEPDLLECALLHWHEAAVDNQFRMIRALAQSGRNACLRWVVALPASDPRRETCVQELCNDPELAKTLLEKSQNPYTFRNWYRQNESNLVPAGDGQFELTKKGSETRTRPATTAPSAEIWLDLVPEVVDRFRESLDPDTQTAVAIMPVIDQTLAGLGQMRSGILAALKGRAADTRAVQLIDEVQFDRWMEQQGPGCGEYWILARRAHNAFPPGLAPDRIVVPICITSRAKESVRYHLELKVLNLHSCEYTSSIAQIDRKELEPGPGRGVLVGGGDTVLARWEHDMVSRNGYDWPLAGVKDLLTAADVAFCNLECCVSLRGTPANKGERCPFYYRARPEMLRCLTQSGIDLVTGANNHNGDYGPPSVADTMAWCTKAGLPCVGIGTDAAMAEIPHLMQIGPVRVGFAGMDTTQPCFNAEQNRPGNNYASEDQDLTAFTEKVARLGQWADGRCDLFILTIHWGKNWVRETQPIHRKMARIAFEHGVDAILGHSAHRLQGIEVVAGKPVVYDMGNLLFDCELAAEGRRSALFRLSLSNKGVHAIEVLPIQALNGYTVRSNRPEANATLAEMRDLCAALGTDLIISEDIEGRPMGILSITEPVVTARAVPHPTESCSQFPAKHPKIQPRIGEDQRTTEIPHDAHLIHPPAELAPGAELVAYQLPETATEGGILYISTWWRVTRPVARHVLPAFHLRPSGKDTPRRGTPWYTRHDAGDWTVPLALVQPGTTLIEDFYPARLDGLPAGPCDVVAMLIDTTQLDGQQILGSHQLGSVQIIEAGSP
ncbi:MAG: CapA family protein [Pirellulales bacterium]|nr:CapA family protein [Pirellulales bacterium]